MALWLVDAEVGTAGEWSAGSSWEVLGCGAFSLLKGNASVSSMCPGAGEKCSQSDGPPAPSADALGAGVLEVDVGGETWAAAGACPGGSGGSGRSVRGDVWPC